MILAKEAESLLLKKRKQDECATAILKDIEEKIRTAAKLGRSFISYDIPCDLLCELPTGNWNEPEREFILSYNDIWWEVYQRLYTAGYRASDVLSGMSIKECDFRIQWGKFDTQYDAETEVSPTLSKELTEVLNS